MKPFKASLSLALSILLLTVSLVALAEEPFAYQDLTFSGIAAGATVQQVQAVLGAPDELSAPETEAATGAQVETARFSGLSMVLRDGKLSDVEFADATYAGPRGLKIGDTEAAVKAAFPFDPAMAQAHANVLYAAGWVDGLDMPLPPSGTVAKREDGSVIYQFLAPVEPYSAETLNNPDSFLFENHAGLTLVLGGADHTLTEMSWFVGALAE